MSNAFIGCYTTMGENNLVYPFASIGSDPEDYGFDGSVTYTRIGSGNRFREGVTVNRATHEGASTVIGDGCFLMANAHVAHNCKVGNNVIMVVGATLGGYVESCDNLDQDGSAWISADAIACENAVVCEDAVLTDHAVARGNAYVGKNATVMGDATVQDDAIVCGGLLTGKSCVCGYAVIRQDEQTLCAPIIDGSARIYGEISGNVVCRGDAVVLPGTKLDNRTQDCFVLEDDRVSVQTASRTPPPKEPRTYDFER